MKLKVVLSVVILFLTHSNYAAAKTPNVPLSGLPEAVVSLKIQDSAQPLTAYSSSWKDSRTIRLAQTQKPIKPQLQITEGIEAPEKPVDNSSSQQKTLPALSGKSEPARIWELVSGTTDVEVLNRFIAKYPGTFQAALAAQKRGELARAAPPREPDPITRIQPIVPPQEPEDLALNIQTELKRLGCNPGLIDGKWGGRSIEAAKAFVKYGGGSNVTAAPNMALLNSLQSSSGKVCPVICGPKTNNVNGQCVAKTCKPGEKLSSRGTCFVPKPRKTAKAPPAPKSSVPKQSGKQRKQCTWCAGLGGREVYICGAERIARARAQGQCN